MVCVPLPHTLTPPRQIQKRAKDTLLQEPFTGIMQNLLTICYTFSTDQQAGFKLWVLAEKMMNQLAVQRQSIGNAPAAAATGKDEGLGIDLSGMLDSVDQTAHIRELERDKQEARARVAPVWCEWSVLTGSDCSWTRS